MVKCADCGFLALRNLITGILDEAPQEYRWRAEIPKFRNPTLGDAYDYTYTGIPICLVRAHPLHNEFTDQNRAKGGEIFTTLERERNCDQSGLFAPWLQGFTPKEHREMLDRQQMLEREDRRDKEQRDWQENQAKALHKWQENLQYRSLLVSGFFIIIGVFLGVLLQR